MDQIKTAKANLEAVQAQADQAQADLKLAQQALAEQQTQGQTAERQYQANRENGMSVFKRNNMSKLALSRYNG
ncbi:Uncharacterised protein [Weissella viridescens]|uniref:Uncharacterized protein n=1 Tax=Weissella viridescens TaxID=1629 RepID=A0A380P7H0_WEIVI|nr:Uncharacterised protein [Weissella viridescens]